MPGLLALDQSFAPHLADPKVMAVVEPLFGSGTKITFTTGQTNHAASWEPNDVYDELRRAGFSRCSEEDQEETFNRFLKPAAPPDSGNGVVVPHEAPDGPPKPKKKGKK